MDELIDPTVVGALRGALLATAPGLRFDALARAGASVPGVRLRGRVDIVRDALLEDAPAAFSDVERIVGDALDDPVFTGWMIWPVTELVTGRALESDSTEDFDAAMALLARLTVRLTGEFAVRDLLNARPERALAIMESWTAQDNEHVRRLASEGSRAYLPWARRVPWLLAEPAATRAIVDALYRDPSEYVRRSVANHLNDLSRVDPSTATSIATGWAAAPAPHTPWVVRHGLRTLVKRADATALELLGFGGGDLRVEAPRLQRQSVPWGESLTFGARVTNDGDSEATAAVDYSIGFLRANGDTSPKTFKLGSRRIGAGESVVVTKTHSFRPITTRTYYPGAHVVTVQANGVLSPEARFELEPPVFGNSKE